MKLVHRQLDKEGEGSFTLVPETGEDMWHTFNLVRQGDKLRSTTIRKVMTESAAGTVSSSKQRTTLTIVVEAVDFDTQAGVLRVKGRNVEENQYVKMGAYHTLDLELNRKFTLMKDEWDSIALDRVDEATDPTRHADLAAIVMQEGLAYLCLITSAMTIIRAKLESNIPRKKKGFQASNQDKALIRFYDLIYQALIRHVNFSIVKCVIVASPGFVKDGFVDYTFSRALKEENKVLLENKGKFLLVHSSSGHKHSLREVLEDPTIANRLSDTKAASEVKALSDFYSMMKVDPQRAFYGIKHVELACENEAIETLLVSDSLFRSQDVTERRRYVKLVDSVRDNLGTVRVFSSMHPSGEQLNQLTGIAAILRFPMMEPSDDEEYSSDENT